MVGKAALADEGGDLLGREALPGPHRGSRLPAARRSAFETDGVVLGPSRGSVFRCWCPCRRLRCDCLVPAAWNDHASRGPADNYMPRPTARPRALPLPGAEVDAPHDDGPTGPVSAGPLHRSTGVEAPWRACVAHAVVLSRGGESLHRLSLKEQLNSRRGRTVSSPRDQLQRPPG